MSNELRFIANGYLYRLMRGNFEEYRGKVMHRNSFGDSCDFYVYDDNDDIIKDLSCPMNEGELDYQYNTVWFKERNKDAAVKLLINRKLDQIDEAMKIIETHKRTIDILKKELGSE